MKLYVWANPYRVPYGSTLVFAIAESEEQAREEALRGDAYAFGDCPNAPDRKIKLGEPARIVDLPCAEWHEWAE